MPIEIEIRKDNRMLTLNVAGKTPIRTRKGSMHFHNSLELLCIAYGSCFGQAFWDYCREEEINPEEFESFVITMEDNTVYITVQHPKDLPKENLKDIERISRICPVSKMLVNSPIIKFAENETPTEILVDETRRSSCCGGQYIPKRKINGTK